MPLHLPKDDFDQPIQALRRSGVAHTAALNNTAQLIALTAGTKFVSFWGTGTFFVKFGDASVVANAAADAVPAGAIDFEPLADVDGSLKTHMSVFAPESVTVYVSERK